MNQEYTKIFSPAGLDWLKIIRKKYGLDELPIVLYSSKGHLLLHQYDWLTNAIELNAEWISKGVATKDAESRIFYKAIDHARQLRQRNALESKQSTLDIKELSLKELVGSLKTSQIWAVLTALASVIGAVAMIAYKLGAALGKMP